MGDSPVTKKTIGLVEFKGKHRVRFEGVVEYAPYPKCVVFAEIHENHRQDKVFRMQLSIQQVFELCERAEYANRSAIGVERGKKMLFLPVTTQSGGTESTLYYGLHNLPAPLFYLNMTKKGADGDKETLNISMDTFAFLSHIKRLSLFADHIQKRFFVLYEAFEDKISEREA